MTFGLQCDEPTSGAILDRAAEGGVDFLDTSDAYPLGGDLATRGVTEEILGRWLRGRRDRFIRPPKRFVPPGPPPLSRLTPPHHFHPPPAPPRQPASGRPSHPPRQRRADLSGPLLARPRV